ncbi:MAG: hypothetical protein KDD73_07640 [Anaerolineales bacterium]|nr:hypothetical protein [Anaerolineales bacterium]MCB9126892.1 hypothetical protein [Ardenticatenales bacterium]MCB9171436.1 hypothetical protein [Ardenticatenales bacterium]
MGYARRRGGSGLLIPAVVVTALLLILGLFSTGGFIAAMFFALPSLFLFWLVKRLGGSAAILTIPAMMGMAMAIVSLGIAFFGWGTFLYSWLLVFPAAFGLGLSVYAQLARKPKADDFGDILTTVGIGGALTGAALHLASALVGGLVSIAGFVAVPLVMLVIGLVVWQKVSKRQRPAPRTSYRPTLADGSDRLDQILFSDEKEKARR